MTAPDYARWLSDAVARDPNWNLAKLGRALQERTGRRYDRAKISKLAKGEQRLRVEDAVLIADILKIPLPTATVLSYRVKVVGFVGAGAEVHFFEAKSLPEGFAAMPPNGTEHTVALEITADSLGAALSGWFAYYDLEARESPADPLVGKLCVAELDTGRTVVRRIVKGSEPGRFHLFGSYGDPLLDQRVAWAAPVSAMMPG